MSNLSIQAAQQVSIRHVEGISRLTFSLAQTPVTKEKTIACKQLTDLEQAQLKADAGRLSGWQSLWWCALKVGDDYILVNKMSAVKRLSSLGLSDGQTEEVLGETMPPDQKLANLVTLLVGVDLARAVTPDLRLVEVGHEVVYKLLEEGLQLSEIVQIVKVLTSKRSELQEQAQSSGAAVYFRGSRTEGELDYLPRGIIATQTGGFALVFNSKTKGDKVLGKPGSFKQAKKTIDLVSGVSVARLSNLRQDSDLMGEYTIGINSADQITFKPLESSYGTYTKKDGSAGEFFMMPLCDGDLTAFPVDAQTPRSEWLSIAFQMIASVAALHRTNKLHRDIKPANFLKQGNNVRLSDLETVIEETDQAAKREPRGTMAVWAPEYAEQGARILIRAFSGDDTGEPIDYASVTNKKGDSWQLGMAILLYAHQKLGDVGRLGRARFILINRKEHLVLLNYISRLPDDWLGHPPHPGSFEYIVYMLLRPNPEERWTAQQALEACHRLNL